MTSETAHDSLIEMTGRAIGVKIVRSHRTKRWNLRYDHRADMLRLSMPAHGAIKPALDWAAQQSAWFERVTARRVPPQEIQDGAIIMLRGTPHRIEWAKHHPRKPEAEDGVIRLGGEEASVPRRVLQWLKIQAKLTLTIETMAFANQIGVVVTRVSVADPRARWGSCSSSGAIRYSWRLILAPPAVLTATVAHEVAHRVHMHHGPDFHALVAQILGREPTAERAWLKTHGVTLHGLV